MTTLSAELIWWSALHVPMSRADRSAGCRWGCKRLTRWSRSWTGTGTVGSPTASSGWRSTPDQWLKLCYCRLFLYEKHYLWRLLLQWENAILICSLSDSDVANFINRPSHSTDILPCRTWKKGERHPSWSDLRFKRSSTTFESVSFQPLFAPGNSSSVKCREWKYL